MNKDAILASIIGFAIGLIITGAVILGPKLVEKFRVAQSQGQVAASQDDNKNQPTPQESIPDATSLTIDNPKPESIVYEDTITISGKRSKNAIVIVTGPSDEAVIGTSDSSTYEGKITLKEGKNDITVASVADAAATTQMLTIYYSKEAK